MKSIALKTLLAGIVAIVFCVPIVPANASANAEKPGTYAQHSVKYIEFKANCQDAGMSPVLRDEAAKKLEAMSAAQFDKQIEFCAKHEVAKHLPQSVPKVAANGDESADSDDDAKLNELLERKALKIFGPPKHQSHEFRGVQKDFDELPSNCHDRRVTLGRGTIVRVDCD